MTNKLHSDGERLSTCGATSAPWEKNSLSSFGHYYGGTRIVVGVCCPIFGFFLYSFSPMSNAQRASGVQVFSQGRHDVYDSVGGRKGTGTKDGTGRDGTGTTTTTTTGREMRWDGTIVYVCTNGTGQRMKEREGIELALSDLFYPSFFWNPFHFR